MWIKVWTAWAWGQSKDYDYHEVESKEAIDERIQEIDSDHWWSDKYRGAKYEIIDSPPKAFYTNEIERLKRTITWSQKKLAKYEAIVDKMKD